MVVEPEPLAMASDDKERSASGRPAAISEKPTRFETDRVAVALRQLYNRIATEPLPRRLLDLANRLKLHR
jgi:hypothetical protein